jgi:hypothetical protein
MACCYKLQVQLVMVNYVNTDNNKWTINKKKKFYNNQ